MVIPYDMVDSVYFEIEVNANNSSSIHFNYQYYSISIRKEMYDDGTHGDLIAGDSKFTIGFDPQEIIKNLTMNDVYRPSVGQVVIDGGSSKIVNAQILTEDFPNYSSCRLSDEILLSEYLINISSENEPSVDELFDILTKYGLIRILILYKL